MVLLFHNESHNCLGPYWLFDNKPTATRGFHLEQSACCHFLISFSQTRIILNFLFPAFSAFFAHSHAQSSPTGKRKPASMPYTRLIAACPQRQSRIIIFLCDYLTSSLFLQLFCNILEPYHSRSN